MAGTYTVVIGIDGSRIRQLRLVWPTWIKHKPSLLEQALVAFYDRDQVNPDELKGILSNHPKLTLVSWPFSNGIDYGEDYGDKWSNPQRHKMLAGFVYVSSQVPTPYWLKLDTDVIATGHDDWVDDKWFENYAKIVAPKWGYTKPADQMMKLDKWVEDNPCLSSISSLHLFLPLKLIPEVGAKKICHPRICSWCAFFETRFTKLCASLASSSIGQCKLPVASQDGYQFYVAKRLQMTIEKVNMKARGWVLKSNEKNIKKYIGESFT